MDSKGGCVQSAVSRGCGARGTRAGGESRELPGTPWRSGRRGHGERGGEARLLRSGTPATCPAPKVPVDRYFCLCGAKLSHEAGRSSRPTLRVPVRALGWAKSCVPECVSGQGAVAAVSAPVQSSTASRSCQ